MLFSISPRLGLSFFGHPPDEPCSENGFANRDGPPEPELESR
jgi:hypothetical protein